MSLFPGTEHAEHAPPVDFRGAWLSDHEAALAYLRRRIEWVHREFREGTMMPRLEALFGPRGAGYTYSGIRYACTPLDGHPVQRLVDRVNGALGTEFNAVFVNLYRSGDDSIGWHRDDEPVLGPAAEVEIASLSLGAPRRFVLRKRLDGRRFARVEWRLGGGDLLYMRAGCQVGWEHSAPKEPGVEGSRMALTFRRLLAREVC